MFILFAVLSFIACFIFFVLSFASDIGAMFLIYSISYLCTGIMFCVLQNMRSKIKLYEKFFAYIKTLEPELQKIEAIEKGEYQAPLPPEVEEPDDK